MPMAVPLIAAYAATSLAVEAGLVIAGSFAATVVGGIASLGASLVMGALTPKPSAPDLSSALSQAGAGRTQQIRQPIAPHQIIAGRVKASGVIVFIHTLTDGAGRANGWLYLVHAVSGTRVRAIYDAYLNETLASDASFGPHARVTAHLGAADQVADADFVSEIGEPYWGADHRLRGRAYLATRLVWDNTLFGSGVPNITAIIEGVDDVYDPRTGLTAWHNNAALFIARWFTASWGMALDWSELDEDSIIAAANVCDERVRVETTSATFARSGATDAFTLSERARVLDAGDGVRFTTTGTFPGGLGADTTYYAIPAAGGAVKFATSPSNAIAGTAIAISSDGTGTHTLLYWDEARYKINGTFALDASKGQVLEQLLSAMAGVPDYAGGKWSLHAGVAAAPTIELGKDDLRGDLRWNPKRKMRDRFNGVRAVYVSPSGNWQPVDAPPLQSDTYLAEDAGEELFTDARFPFTTSGRTVQRLQKIALERNRRQGTLTFPAKLTAMRLRVWDGVYVTLARYGWSRKQFRVIGWALAEDGGVDLALQEDDADVYAWSSAEERPQAQRQAVVMPDPNTIAAPASIIVDTPTIPVYSRINATIAEVKSIWQDGYDVEFKPSVQTTWSSTGRIYTELLSIVESEAIDIQARAVTHSGSPSAFTQNIAPSVPTDLAVDGAIATRITWTNGALADQVQVFSGNSTLAAATLYDTVPAVPAHLDVTDNAFYWLRSVNAQGNVSNMTTSIEVGTGTGTGDGGGDGSSGGDGGSE